MREDHSPAELFDGIVQVDDYYHGGDPRPEEKGTLTRGRGSEKKTTILGAVESDSGKVRTAHVPRLTQAEVADTLDDWLDLEKTELHSDKFSGYGKIGRMAKRHRKVNHDVWYVTKDGVHCNAVENVWSLFSRAVMGSFHHISRKHLHRYLAELDSRFNSRNDDVETFFNRILRQGNGRTLTLSSLTS